MNSKEALIRLLKDNNKTQTWIAEKMGYKSQSGFSSVLVKEYTIKTLLKICDIFEYEVIIQPKRRAGSRPAGQIVIDLNKEREEKEKDGEQK